MNHDINNVQSVSAQAAVYQAKGAQIPEAPPQTILDAAYRTACSQSDRLQAVAERLESLCARAFGPEPISGNAGVSNAPAPTGAVHMLGAVTQRIDDLLIRLQKSVSDAERLV